MLEAVPRSLLRPETFEAELRTEAARALPLRPEAFRTNSEVRRTVGRSTYRSYGSMFPIFLLKQTSKCPKALRVPPNDVLASLCEGLVPGSFVVRGRWLGAQGPRGPGGPVLGGFFRQAWHFALFPACCSGTRLRALDLVSDTLELPAAAYQYFVIGYIRLRALDLWSDMQ